MRFTGFKCLSGTADTVSGIADGVSGMADTVSAPADGVSGMAEKENSDRVAVKSSAAIEQKIDVGSFGSRERDCVSELG